MWTRYSIREPHTVPPHVANLLGYHKSNRLGVKETYVVGGWKTTSDRHCLEYVKVGTARAHRVGFLVDELGPAYSLIVLLGLTFIRNFTTTVNFDENLVLFRPSKASR